MNSKWKNMACCDQCVNVRQQKLRYVQPQPAGCTSTPPRSQAISAQQAIGVSKAPCCTRRLQYRGGCSRGSSKKERSLVTARAVAESADPQVKPAYNIYRSPGEISIANMQKWKDLSAEGVDLPPATALSNFRYVFSWLKYTIVPEPIRYVWYLIWSALRTAWYPYHKKFVLQGAKLDVYLQQKAQPRAPVTVSKRVALKRFHWNMGVVENTKLRFGLAKAALLTTLSNYKRKNLTDTDHSGLTRPTLL